MNEAARITCLGFLKKLNDQQRNALLLRLAPQERAVLSHLPSTYGDPTKPSADLLQHVHYSWLAPVLRSLPENEIRLFLAALSEQQAKGLKKALLLSNQIPTLNPIAKTFFEESLLNKFLDHEEILPMSCLPSDPINRLLDLNENELRLLIDLLSMHDLSVELKQVIDTARLKQISNSLSKDQAAFLKTLISKKEPVAFKRMSLGQWDGNTETLRALLYQRGLNRLAKAIYGKNPSFIWHFTRRLDIELAQSILKLSSDLGNSAATRTLAHQVEELIAAIKSKAKP